MFLVSGMKNGEKCDSGDTELGILVVAKPVQRMARLLWAGRKVIVTQVTICYKQSVQKSVSVIMQKIKP